MKLAQRRLAAQQITGHAFAEPAGLVAWMGAVQAQDYAAARWAVALRLDDPRATEATIERAVDDGAVVRTHVFRWTWQLVAPADLRWMLSLVTERLVARAGTRHRELGLDTATFRRSGAALEKALAGGRHLTRAEIAAALARAGVATTGQRLSHLLGHAELEGLICSGARRGKQATYALLDHRVPASGGGGARLARDEALAELAARYFRSRGPATADDFAWWAGLALADARAGLESAKAGLVGETVDGRTYWQAADTRARAARAGAHLLPGFDEYLVAYRERDAMIDPKHARQVNNGGGILRPCVLVDGQVVGTWRRVLGRKRVEIQLALLEKPAASARAMIDQAAARYAAFLGLELDVKTKQRSRS
jgi:hypothetical protein